MASRWISEESWLHAISVKQAELARYTTVGYFIPYSGPKPDAAVAQAQKRVRQLRSSIGRIIAAGDADWRERLDARGP